MKTVHKIQTRKRTLKISITVNSDLTRKNIKYLDHTIVNSDLTRKNI